LSLPRTPGQHGLGRLMQQRPSDLIDALV
jgi:hypothetical protein